MWDPRAHTPLFLLPVFRHPQKLPREVRKRDARALLHHLLGRLPERVVKVVRGGMTLLNK